MYIRTPPLLQQACSTQHPIAATPANTTPGKSHAPHQNHELRPCSTVRSSLPARPEFLGGGYSERPEVRRRSTDAAAARAAATTAAASASPTAGRHAPCSMSEGIAAAATSKKRLLAAMPFRALASAPEQEVQWAVCCVWRSSRWA